MPCMIIPTLKYENASSAIEWLCEAFGFEKHLIVEGEGGRIEHAQLTLGEGMIMLGSVRESNFNLYQKVPTAVGGVGTQSPYIVVSDVDGHCARAVKAGAQVVLQPEDQEYGGRLYSCLDP